MKKFENCPFCGSKMIGSDMNSDCRGCGFWTNICENEIVAIPRCEILKTSTFISVEDFERFLKLRIFQ
jgi:hypothetical protein